MSADFGGSGITRELYDWILANIPQGSCILELGSGSVSTQHLSKHYRMVSVEDNAGFVGKFESHYIHAPNIGGWYDVSVLRRELSKVDPYRLLLVDGPSGSISRMGLMGNLSLFNLDAVIIIDDTWRPVEKQMAAMLSQMLGRPAVDYVQFTVIPARISSV